MAEYTIVNDVPPNDATWAEWTELVENELWLADDRSVTSITPSSNTTRSVVAKDKDGKLIGSVVWNEQDNLAWIGFYLLKESYRGKGIGSILWKQAIDRIKATGYTIGLRGVPLMAHKYKAQDTPYQRDMVGNHIGKWDSFAKLATKYAKKDVKQWQSGNLDETQLKKVFDFDLKVTGRNRKEFLMEFMNFPFTYTSVLENENDEIIAMAFITTTGPRNANYYKVAPIYASTVVDAMTVSLPLFEYAGNQKSDAIILINIVDSIGRDELEPLFVKEEGIDSNPNALTSLYSTQFEETFRKDLLFAPHNNSGHYDA